MRKGKVIITKGSEFRNKANDYFDTSVKHGEVKDVTEDYKKSLLTKKVVKVKSRYDRYWGIGRRFPIQDPKLWQPQPNKVCIGKRNGVKIMQYVAPFTLQQ